MSDVIREFANETREWYYEVHHRDPKLINFAADTAEQFDEFLNVAKFPELKKLIPVFVLGAIRRAYELGQKSCSSPSSVPS